LLKTQQQSDTTYRLYDYGRPRPLHLERGLASVKERTASGKVIRPAPVAMDGGKNRRSSMIAAPYFAVELFELRAPHDFSMTEFERNDSGKTSAQVLVAIEGCGVVEAQGRDPVTFAKSDAVVIPAALQGFTVRPQWQLEFLKACVPSGTVPEPATRM
jgi:mannose-6-phosphate isomerase